MVVSARQPGSALKPFLYGLAFDNGMSAATVLADIPTSYATSMGPYAPRNYDRRYRGPVRVREALASSYNVPAVEMASRVGAASLLRTLRLAGFESLQHDADYYGLGLALGNGDVTLIEMANAYRALANGGAWRPWTWRGSMDNRPASAVSSRRIMSPVASAIILDILRDPTARIPGFGVSTPFDFPFPAAVKTGTSRHFTDNWAVATTGGFTVAVWAGNFSGRPMEGVSGVSGAGPLLHRVVMATAQHVSPGRLTSPADVGATQLRVCRLSGLRATTKCAQMSEWFAPGTAPTRVDDWEHAGRITLPDEYAEWARTGLRVEAGVPGSVDVSDNSEGDLSASNADVATPAPPHVERQAQRESKKAPAVTGFRILSPLDGDHYSVPPGVDPKYSTIPLLTSAASGVRWSVDGREYSGERWKLVGGAHVIEAVTAGGKTARVRIVVEP
jgi:penicillin-binding protein 1C